MPSKLEKLLHNLLVPRLDAMGFTPMENLIFGRDATSDCRQIIPVQTRSVGGQLKFTCGLWLRFESIEAILRPDSTDLSFPTVGYSIHLLSPEHGWYEWEGGNEEELAIAADAMVAEIRNVGLDYFEQFPDIESLHTELASSPVSENFTLDPIRRIYVLAAILLSWGKRSEAEALFEEGLTERWCEHPGRRRQFEKARQQLFGD